MAPMAIDESFSGSMASDVNGGDEIEDVVLVGAGPAGLMLSYVCYIIWKFGFRLTENTQFNLGSLRHQVEGVR